LAPGVRQSVVVAVRTLFGVHDSEIQAVLDQIRPVDLKQVFRKRALESHPDRARVLGKCSEELAGEFRSVAAAYDILKRHVGARSRSLPQSRCAQAAPPAKTRSAHAARPTATDHKWAQGLPKRHLRIGQYLYYSGKISWRVLIQALVWQGQQRPCFGRLAEGWGYVSSEDIRNILTHRRLGEAIGEAAVRLGLLTQYQRDAVVGMQKRMQRRLGDYFVESGFLSQKEMDEIVRKHRQHNFASAWIGDDRKRRAA